MKDIENREITDVKTSPTQPDVYLQAFNVQYYSSLDEYSDYQYDKKNTSCFKSIMNYFLGGKHNLALFIALFVYNCIGNYFFVFCLFIGRFFFNKYCQEVNFTNMKKLSQRLNSCFFNIYAVFCGLFNLFVYYWILFRDNPNFLDTSAIIILQLIYISLANTGNHYHLSYKFILEQQFIDQVFSQIGIDKSNFYFEFMTRETIQQAFCIENFDSFKKSCLIVSLDYSNVDQNKFLKKMANQREDNNKIVKPKVWNPCSLLALDLYEIDFPKHKKQLQVELEAQKSHQQVGSFRNSSNNKRFKFKDGFQQISRYSIYIAMIGVVIQIGTLIFFSFKKKDSEYLFYIIHSLVIQFYYWFVHFDVHYKFFGVVFLTRGLSVFTMSMELENVIQGTTLQKVIPTINICCIQSVRSWYFLREALFKIYNNKQIKISASQLVDLVFIIILCIALFLDTLGIFWKRSTIASNPLLIIFIFTNIIQRVLSILIPVIYLYSEINSELLYQIEQINLVLELLQELKINLSYFKQNNQNEKMGLREMINEKIYEEIKRNAYLYKNSDDLDTQLQYIEELISLYSITFRKMKDNPLQLCFLGYFQITYSSLSALALTFISPVLSYIYSQIN